MNILIIRTERGQGFVDYAVKKGFLQIDEMPAANLEHLETAANNKKKRALSKAMSEGRVNSDEEGARSMLRLNADTINRIVNAGGAK